MFELSLIVRDSQGNPTGKRKFIATDSTDKLAAFWYRNKGHTKKKRRDVGTADGKGAEKTLKELYSKSIYSFDDTEGE